MGKSDAVVTIDFHLPPHFNQRLCILLVWKPAERPGKYSNAELGDIVHQLKYIVYIFFKYEPKIPAEFTVI